MTPHQPPTPSPSTPALEIIDLGKTSYQNAYAQQIRYRDSLINANKTNEPPPLPRMKLLLLEHDPPVITVSKRPAAAQHITASPERLKHLGIEIRQTDRGGDITYHGPGQLVAYPILDLKRLNLGVRDYMHALEQIVIDTIAEYDIIGTRDPAATGVWVEHPNHKNKSQLAKICALGVRISRWITMHGLALNVSTNLDHFNTIIPCGLEGRPVTSMKQILTTQQEKRVPEINDVKKTLATRFQLFLLR